MIGNSDGVDTHRLRTTVRDNIRSLLSVTVSIMKVIGDLIMDGKKIIDSSSY